LWLARQERAHGEKSAMALDVLFGVVLVLGVMILVHEWGHFIVARLFGVRVDVFSIGFGPRLFGWKRGATDYRISAVPLGGYVRMAGQDPTEIDSQGRGLAEKGDKLPTGAPDELMSKPRWQRALISFAGPAVNLLFPVLLLAVYFGVLGIPYPAFADKAVVVTAFPGSSPAAAGGLHPGDRVISINGQSVANWADAEKAIAKADPSGQFSLELENGGTRRTVEVAGQPKPIEQPEQLLGFYPVKPVLEDVQPGFPAARAGLKENDVILAVDGKKIGWWGEFTDRVRGSNGHPVAIDVQRDGRPIHMVVTPQAAVNDRGDTYYQIGVQVHEDTAYRRVGLVESARYASMVTTETIQQTVGVVGRLLSGRVSVKQLQSVVGISRAAGQAVHKGTQAVIFLMVMISVNLGILNLLPIPILDGGNILLLAIEGGMRRDLSMAFKERFVQVGLVFLLVLFAYVMYNDVVRLLPFHS
jgi:regulator of sigma E protease